jgi:SAM-dependent methyltransferase
MADYREFNRANWDQRAPIHARSATYAFDRYAAEPEYLSHVVAFDLPRLGDVRGLRGIHLQCHIGTDTISLARLGAQMTGLDFSSESLRQARQLAGSAAATNVDFVEADVYDAVAVCGAGEFQLVYTGIGALCWLPDIRRWAGVVAGLLSPGGRLFLRESHPMLLAVDEEREDGVLAVGYPYFETVEPLVWEAEDTYVETAEVVTATTMHLWNHGLGEIVTALLEVGMEITMLAEHDTVPYDALPGQMEDAGGGEFRLAEHRERLPLTFTLQARKR